MAQSIILKRSAIAGKVPDTASLNLGEVAINTYDGRLFFRKSGSAQSVEHIITTNSTTTGSITLTGTGSFGTLNVTGTGSFNEIFVTTDINVTGSGYFIGDIVGLSDVDVAGDLSGSHGMLIGKNALRVTSGSTNYTEINGNLALTGSAGISGDLTVLGQVNARQFNINVISSSVIYTSGSTKFGDTQDDVMSVTGSFEVSGSTKFTDLGGVSLLAFSSSMASRIASPTIDANTLVINNIDASTMLNNSVADLFLQLGVNGYLDFDFNS